MQGVQKIKCASCGVMFMTETGANKCPECSNAHGQEHGHDHSHGDSGMGGCGCGHSH